MSRQSPDVVERVATVVGPHIRVPFTLNPDVNDQAEAADSARQIARLMLEACHHTEAVELIGQCIGIMIGTFAEGGTLHKRCVEYLAKIGGDA